MNLQALSGATRSNNGGGFKLPDPGAYMGYIDRGEVRESRTGNKYINYMIKLTNAEGKACGNIWYKLFDSDKNFLQYQAARFIEALNIPMEGELGLDDLLAISLKQEVTVCVKIEEGENGYNDQAVVDWDMFDGFQPIEKFDTVYDAVANGVPAPETEEGAWNVPGDDEVEFI